MLYQLKLPFVSKNNIKYSWSASSLMHGVIMENITSDYAEEMHQSTLRPFSQSVRYEGDKNIWTISTLTKEAYERIMVPLLSLKQAEITQKNDIITLSEPEIRSISYEQLFKDNYIYSEQSRYIRLEFCTPTSFKHNNAYVNMPDTRSILSGLARRYDALCDIHDSIYDKLFDEFEQHVKIIAYNLRSTGFPLEGVRIPAFLGTLTLKISGNPTFCNYVNMLCDFAEYSGVGIKTALGMGQVKRNNEHLNKGGEIVEQ